MSLRASNRPIRSQPENGRTRHLLLISPSFGTSAPTIFKCIGKFIIRLAISSESRSTPSMGTNVHLIPILAQKGEQPEIVLACYLAHVIQSVDVKRKTQGELT